MNAWRSMNDLLEVERRALLTGQLKALPEIEAQKKALTARLSEPAPDELKRKVHARAERNADLIEAAGRGVKAALQQVSEARAGGTLRTYDDDGCPQTFRAQQSSVERKA